MKPHISLVTLGVNNLEASTDFYQKGLALPLSSHSNENISFFELTGTWLALYPRHLLAADIQIDAAGTGFSGVTLAHNVKSKQEVDEVLSTANLAGAVIVKPAQDTFWGGYSGYFRDVDDYLWEVAWNPHFWIE